MPSTNPVDEAQLEPEILASVEQAWMIFAGEHDHALASFLRMVRRQKDEQYRPLVDEARATALLIDSMMDGRLTGSTTDDQWRRLNAHRWAISQLIRALPPTTGVPVPTCERCGGTGYEGGVRWPCPDCTKTGETS